MSFKKAIKIDEEIKKAQENGLFKRAQWRDEREYERLFKLVWNSGKKFLARCESGKLPVKKDFALFYQEDIYKDLLFVYKDKKPLKCNTAGFNLKCRMINSIGTAYPLCLEDIQTFISHFHFLRFWLPGEIRVMECDPRNQNFTDAFQRIGLSICREYRRGKSQLETHIKIHKPHILVLYGTQAICGTKVPRSVNVVLLAEVEIHEVPTYYTVEGDVMSVTNHLHVWLRH